MQKVRQARAFQPPGVNRLGNGLFCQLLVFAGVSGAVEQLILGMKLPGSALNYSDSQDWGLMDFHFATAFETVADSFSEPNSHDSRWS
ncbi:MAG: hypothetical protein CM15mP68_0290 [Pseudomonadota bacterium]|nr:MAG: hypothetical protein CM15mP68_0290 [Pseudomonadota bacterium]